jgi:hypothetical protein
MWEIRGDELYRYVETEYLKFVRVLEGLEHLYPKRLGSRGQLRTSPRHGLYCHLLQRFQLSIPWPKTRGTRSLSYS